MTAQSKATLKTYFETGDYPTELQFADLVDSFDDVGSAAAKKMLTDYANVVVVDVGGNGDYTTLAAAMAAITDASASKVYEIWLFGKITESGSVTCKDYVNVVGSPNHVLALNSGSTNLLLGTATYKSLNLTVGNVYTTKTCRLETCLINGLTLEGAVTVTALDCDIRGTISNAVTGGGTVILRHCQVTTTGSSQAFSPTAAITLKAYNTQFASAVDGIVVASSTGFAVVIEMHNCSVAANLASGAAFTFLVIGGTHTLKLINCHIINTGATSNGLSVTNLGGTLAFYASHSTFKGTSKGAIANAAWANAPFYFCVFDGGTTNITPNAGTAAGTCVTF